jgi:carboxypeptidase family protein
MVSAKKHFDDGCWNNFTFKVVDACLRSDMSRRVLQLIVACLIIVSSAVAQTGAASGRVDGTVFVQDSEGPSYVPGAKVTLSGRVSVEQEADQQGRFSFAEVAPGAYTLSAQFPGLEATQSIEVEAGKATNAALELKPSEVKTEVTVRASQSEVKGKAPTQTISSTAVRDAPNLSERTESVPPLIPGVVRGPDGRINVKGARNTQSGALVCDRFASHWACAQMWAELGRLSCGQSENPTPCKDMKSQPH